MKAIHVQRASAETLDFPDAITLTILLTGKDTGGTHAVFEDVVRPGVGPARHIHHDQDETFLILEGIFEVEISGQLYQAVAGDLAFVPRGSVHAFRNTGNTDGRLQYIFSPALNIDSMFRLFHEAQDNGNLSQATMTSIAQEFGQEFVGPPLGQE